MKRLVLTLVTIGVLMASGGAYYKWRNGGEQVQVSTSPVLRGDVVSTVGATGTLDAVTTVQVGTQVSGTVRELNADFNSLVRKGQVIARLDPSLFETQVEQSRANLVRSQADVERLRVSLDDARTKLKRAEELSGRNLIPRSELEASQVAVKAAEAQLRSAQAQVTQAEASLNQSQVNLQHTVISAPIDGIVISRNVDVGQTVAASLSSPTLFLLAADLTKMKVSASIDESDVGRIRPGQHVRFRVDAYPTEEFRGTVLQVRLQPVVVQNVVTYATVIDVPNPELKLKPGMTANVTIEVARRDDVLKVPNAALRFRPTTEIFAALKQTPPNDGEWRGGLGAPGGGGGRRDFQRGGGEGRGAGATAGGRPTGTSGPSPPSSLPSDSAPSVAQNVGSARDARGADQQAGGQRQGGGRGADDPEQRRQLMERLEKMPPEEREAFLKRMRERGRSGESGQSGRGEGAGRGGSGRSDRAGRTEARSDPAAQATPLRKEGATTIDSLFGPLPAVETSGRVWIYVNNQLQPVRLRLGIADTTHTEVISGDVKEGMPLVTSVSTGAETATSGSGRSPLMPQRGFGPGGGGRSPGGAGAGRGG
ncbi:MAG: efflux RND transporter periplasmic adaptor subunit [Acidobacteria bacterium]|nr:efflux RND transporter periplasmic adaptor subunit [Acidobacteriota bacterium]